MRTVTRPPRGFTLLEILVVLTVIGIVVGWAVSRVTSSGYRMDANVRLVQNALLAAQQTAISRSSPVQVMFDASGAGQHRLRVLVDADDDGVVSMNEDVRYRPLSGANFLTPPATIDGASPGYVTGPGLVSGRPEFRQAIRIAPNGTLGGDVVVYIGTSTARPEDLRAIAISGATARSRFWSNANGSWAQRNY